MYLLNHHGVFNIGRIGWLPVTCHRQQGIRRGKCTQTLALGKAPFVWSNNHLPKFLIHIYSKKLHDPYNPIYRYPFPRPPQKLQTTEARSTQNRKLWVNTIIKEQ